MVSTANQATAEEILLEARGISKGFTGVQALQSVNFTLRSGEVHALLGENGAGKSTLIKILSGVYQSDSGSVSVMGQQVRIKDPQAAQGLGIATVHQELNLVPHLSVAENIFMGRLPRLTSFGGLDWKRLYTDSRNMLLRIGLDLDPKLQVRTLGVAQKQMVEIAKAISMNARVFIFDEPTAALTGKEVDSLFTLIQRLTSDGAGVVYISHRLAELSRIADRVTVLRDGKDVGTLPVREATPTVVTQLMIGREVATQYPPRDVECGPDVLVTKAVASTNGVRGVSIALRRGEIVGLYGLMGSGRTELVRAIIGADPMSGGEVHIKGKRIERMTPTRAIALGVGYLPEERRTNGLLLDFSVRDNITLASLNMVSTGQFLNRVKENELADQFVRSLGIKTPNVFRKVRVLSGGNQQKVVLAKWLCAGCDILLFDEPTRGIDVGAKVEVYRVMNDLVAKGTAILMVSSELPEIMGMSDRILVMHEGKIALEVTAREATEQQLLQAALGLQSA